MPWSIADFRTVRLSCVLSLPSNGTISNLMSFPAHCSLVASSAMYCQLRIWFWPTGAMNPVSGSIQAILTVSAEAVEAANADARAKANVAMRLLRIEGLLIFWPGPGDWTGHHDDSVRRGLGIITASGERGACVTSAVAAPPPSARRRRPRPVPAAGARSRSGGGELVLGELLAQLRLEDLAGGPERDRLDELDVVGRPPLRDLALVVGDQLLARHLRAGLAHHDQQGALVPLRMRHPDHGGVGHRRMGERQVLEVDRADPFPAGLDDVLAAVGDLHVAIGVDRGDVARREPALAVLVVHQRIATLPLEVLLDHPGPASEQVAEGLAVPGHLLVVVVGDLEVDPEDHVALLLEDLLLLLLGQLEVLALQAAERAERRGLGHAPGVDDFHAVLVLEGPDHGRRAGRAADDRAREAAEAQV